ncbi:MAG: substrate-binding domain-containing protein, partial [Demequinaceae bacterium]|nr:substrate-binding domain-containing protein [Demequinaceae bacterium]
FTTFVDAGVDVILLSPTEGSGWDAALRQAQEAQIPVVLIDGGIVPDDTNLYVTRVANDNSAIAATVADWAVTAFPEGAAYFVLDGPSGTDATNQRHQGWDSVMADHPEFDIRGSQAAHWSADEARLATESMLRANDNMVPLIVAQGDEMGLGAALAVEAAGLTPGIDVKIATIGGSKGALQALLSGRLSFVAELNPLFGPTAVDVVRTVLSGGTVDRSVVVPSEAFASVTQEELDARQYY